MQKNSYKIVAAMAIGAASALCVGIPLAALIWSLMASARGPVEQALFSAYFALIWGFYLTWPSSLVLGAVGGVFILRLARWLQGGEFFVWVALCGASLGALNGALGGVWFSFPESRRNAYLCWGNSRIRSGAHRRADHPSGLCDGLIS